MDNSNIKESLKDVAINWTKSQRRYPISKGIVYGDIGPDVTPIVRTTANAIVTKVCVEKMFISQAIEKYLGEGKNIYVLNFASFKNPGGGFMSGMMAQEEALCHITNLYNHLVEETDYYAFNNKNKNRALYQNRCIIHRNVIYNNSKPINVITCAAPNVKASNRYKMSSREEQLDAMRNRILFLYQVMCQFNDIDVLLLGAWGCGVFGNDPRFVAETMMLYFKYLPVNQYPAQPIVVYPIPDQKNYDVFYEVAKNNGYIE